MFSLALEEDESSISSNPDLGLAQRNRPIHGFSICPFRQPQVGSNLSSNENQMKPDGQVEVHQTRSFDVLPDDCCSYLHKNNKTSARLVCSVQVSSS